MSHWWSNKDFYHSKEEYKKLQKEILKWQESRHLVYYEIKTDRIFISDNLLLQMLTNDFVLLGKFY